MGAEEDGYAPWLAEYRVSCLDLRVFAGAWPGVRRAGLPKAKLAAAAGPAGPRSGTALIIDMAQFGSVGWHRLVTVALSRPVARLAPHTLPKLPGRGRLCEVRGMRRIPSGAVNASFVPSWGAVKRLYVKQRLASCRRRGHEQTIVYVTVSRLPCPRELGSCETL